MMAAEIKSEVKFEAGVPRPLFEVRLPSDAEPWFDVSKDGRFSFRCYRSKLRTRPMTEVINWQAGLKK